MRSIFYILLFLFFFYGCTKEEKRNGKDTKATSEAQFEDIFSCIDTIIFPTSSIIGEISKVCSFSDGRKVVVDNISHKLYFFTANGKIYYEFGKRGKGKGEFLDIYDLSVSKDGYLFVLDGVLKRVTVLKDTVVIRTFIFNFGTSIWADDSSHIYIYDASIVSDIPNVFHYDWDGNMVKKYGCPGKATLASKMPVSKGSILLANDSLYTLSAIDYEIKLYHKHGEYISSFANLPDFYIFVSELFKDGPKRENLKKIIGSYPMFLISLSNTKTISVQITNLKERHLHFYHLDGIFIKSIRLPSNLYCIGSADKYLFLLYEETTRSENPKILVYALSQNGRL